MLPLIASFASSELVSHINPVTARQGSPEEAASGELRIVNLVGQILRPGGHRPSFPLEAGPEVDQIDGIARGYIVRVPPGTANFLVVETHCAVDPVDERLAVLRTEADGVLRQQRGVLSPR